MMCEWNLANVYLSEKLLTHDSGFLSKEEYHQHAHNVGAHRKTLADRPFQTRQACSTTILPFHDPEAFRYLAAQYRHAGIGLREQSATCAWNTDVSL